MFGHVLRHSLSGWDCSAPMKNRYAMRYSRDWTRIHHEYRAVAHVFQTVPALNYAFALVGVRLRRYLLGTLLGLPLPIALYCLFFAQLARHFQLS